jgi:hypothetical protein
MCGVDFPVVKKCRHVIYFQQHAFNPGKATTLTSKEWNKSALFCNLS